jgi:hypothetical protein
MDSLVGEVANGGVLVPSDAYPLRLRKTRRLVKIFHVERGE